MTKTQSLTAAQAKTLAAFVAAGGTVGEWLDSYKAAGIDGRSLPALSRKGLVRYNHEDGRVSWTVSITDAGRAAIA